MAEDVYRQTIVIDVTGDETSKKKLKAIDNYINTTDKLAKKLDKTRINPVAKIKDQASQKIKDITAKLGKMTQKTWNITMMAKDKVTPVIKGIFQKIMNPIAMLGVGAGIAGLLSLTVGQAMTWETQAVSMEHWLKGNKTLAMETTNWLEKMAAATPFEMGDLFPAMSRGIGITGGDVSLAKRMVKLSADMAGLTPGKTVQDAMEALADAQMGEYERLKEFQMKMSKEQMQKLGGFLGFLTKAESLFAGGAQKLSETALGRISTITDTIKTLFRGVGMGILDAMQPRLAKIVDWFNQNQAQIERWKTIAIRFGKEWADGLLNSAERVFTHIRTKYLENPDFQKLDFGGKVSFVIGDILENAQKWLDGGGRQQLAKIGKMVTETLSETLKLSAPMLADAGVVLAQAFGAAMFGAIKGAVKNNIINLFKLDDYGQLELTKPITDPYGIVSKLRELLPTSLKEKIKSKVPGKVPGHADGGIFDRPHLAWFAEKGPEAAVPLSPSSRGRAYDIWSQVGNMIGAFSPAPAAAGSGNISLSIPLQVINSQDYDREQLVNEVGERVVTAMEKVLENRP